MTLRYTDQPNPDLLRLLPMTARTVLDVGCGTGALGAAHRVRIHGARLLGIERDPQAAAIAATRLDAVACLDVEQNPLPFALDEGIDCIVYGDVLQQLRNPWNLLREHLKALTPGGTVLVCVPNAEHWSLAARLLQGKWRYEEAGLLDERHLRWFTLRTILQALRDAGLTVEEIHPRVFADQARQFTELLVPALRKLGIDPQNYAARALPLQYVLRARLAEAEPTAVSPRQGVSAADIAREIVTIEPSVHFVPREPVELDGLTDEIAPHFACATHTAEVRSFRFSDVVLNTACMLLFDGERPIRETNYLLSDSEYRRARIADDQVIELPADQTYIIGCNRDHANYYHWLIQAIPAIDSSVRVRGSVLAIPPLQAWQERSLELLDLADMPRLTLDLRSQYRFPDVEYSEFLNGSAAFRISLRAMQTFRRMRAKVPHQPCPHEIIYVAGTGNETELIRLLEQEGVGIIIPGSLSLDEQINTFRAARMVIGPHGAGLSNIVFCEPATILYELIPEHDPNSCINRLALAAGVHYVADAFPSRGGDYDLDRIIGRIRALRARIAQPAAAVSLTAPSPPQEDLPLEALLMHFESLGDSCEFGLVQREAGAEPLSLLRFASPHIPVEMRPDAIAAALKNEFNGLGNPDTIRLTFEGERREIIVHETAYRLMHHSFKHKGEVELEDFCRRETKRLIFLRDKLLADLRAAEKLWVWKSNVLISDQQIEGLLDAVRGFGSNVLLWVVTADADHPSGTVERLRPGLLKGYISRFAPYDDALDISFDDWYELCRNAYASWRLLLQR